MLLIHPVPEERLAARVHRPVGMDSRWMTPTPGGGWPSRAQLLMGTLPAAADRDQTAPMAADTGLPAMRGTAAHTQGDAPSAPMVPAGPPATAPCLGEYKLQVDLYILGNNSFNLETLVYWERVKYLQA